MIRKMNQEIIIVSGNEGKIKETQEILSQYRIIPIKKLKEIEELEIDIDVEEDQPTFERNAIKKAETIAKKLGKRWCLSDDSGIQIEYLNNFPGVYTKRWHTGTDRQRNLAIIQKLKGIPKERRKIKFVTAIAISNGEDTISAVSSIEGYVAESPRGINGFGFDEIFELENGKTLAEISQEEKNEISARKKALEEMKSKI
ncbi:MAG: RdgB/HAM1 family non-canonical purine NTP pyrophosphatase [Clostridia bacterium]|nr:RdgB/HAM1 family non-canonical purine NTP pyrophosphatase [Clostridia bacterium]